MADKTDYDLIILGAGPAGMTAGVYAARKQLDMLIIAADIGGQTNWSAQVENYLGFVFIPGTELVQKFEEHLKSFDVRLEYTKATRVNRLATARGFEIDTEDGRRFTARTVIVATGKSPRMLGVPGEKEFIGRGVSYCSTCDGPIFAGLNIMVVGGGNSGLDAVMQLMKICPRVYLVEREKELRADQVVLEKARSAENVEILAGTEVKEIHGDTMVNGVTVADIDTGKKREIDVKGIFVEIGLSPNSGLVSGLVPLNKSKEIPVDCGARTAVPGIYAAGDVTDVPEKQIICAAGDGAKAALGAYSYLMRLPATLDWAS